MPRYEKKQIEAAAKEQGFTRDAYEKVMRLIDLLRFLSADKDLSDNLVLKGGTAINLTMFSLPRLSVDLDFDFAKNLSREIMLEKRNAINSILLRYLIVEGYTFSPKSKTTHSLDSFIYSYTTSGQSNDNIKIEINYSLRSHVLPICEKPIIAPIDEGNFSIRMLSPVEIFASKTVAFMNRGAARDLYDLYNMISESLFAGNELILLRKCVAFYSAISGNHMITNNSNVVFPVITPQMIKTDLKPMLRISEYFDAEDVYKSVSAWLSELLIFSDDELHFGIEFSKGRYKPELLFKDIEILSRIQPHPMAAWRINRINEDRKKATRV
jgi:predicted nucleotidyltransferase component of viral defense system